MYTAISTGALGIHSSGLRESIGIAKSAGYQGLEISIHEAATLIDQYGIDVVRGWFNEAGVRPAAWGMPVNWNGPEEEWRKGIDDLGVLAKAAQQLGCGRTMTWIMSGSNDLDATENRKFHVKRFKPIAEVLAAHDCRLGLEFLGPKTIWGNFAHPFAHTMEDMLAMGDEIGPNVGLLLDAWHWHTSGGTVEALLQVPAHRIVYVHMNDAPPNVAMDDYVDNVRALPGATGVIDIAGFLGALAQIGYDGPLTPEPFGNPATWAMDGLKQCLKRAGL